MWFLWPMQKKNKFSKKLSPKKGTKNQSKKFNSTISLGTSEPNQVSFSVIYRVILSQKYVPCNPNVSLFCIEYSKSNLTNLVQLNLLLAEKALTHDIVLGIYLILLFINNKWKYRKGINVNTISSPLDILQQRIEGSQGRSHQGGPSVHYYDAWSLIAAETSIILIDQYLG